MKYSINLFTLLLILIATPAKPQENKYSVFDAHRGGQSKWIAFQNNEDALYEIILNEAMILLDKRKHKTEQLKTKQDWQNYQAEMREKMFGQLSTFEKTPLNAKITGILERENFKVEKVLFESQPGLFVTAGLFIPKNLQKPAPAVIYCSGHTEFGFRSKTYQQVIINLVEKGFVVFAFDPIGQGERLQYVNPQTGKSQVGGSTNEHSYAGVQTLLTGTSLSDYFIWDGVRAIDYLETRKEVDAERIGITGRSGGGTQTALIAAFDERIYAAAPECYITNFKRLLQSIGPQDAEQNPYFAIKKGFDHPDFLHLRAPKPSLIITTTHDFFSQQGARETFEEVKKSYDALGHSENIEFTEDFGIHESTKGNRETLYAFFQNHLGLPGNSADYSIEPFEPEELWVTETGQVQTSFNGKTVFDLNLEHFSKSNSGKNELLSKIREVSGIEFNRNLSAAVYTGKITTDDFDVEKYFLENDRNDFALPLYVIQQPETATQQVLVWLHPEGKSAVLKESLLEKLTAQFTVFAVDLPGIGELASPDFHGDSFIDGVPFNYTFGANLVGKSISGIRAESLDLLMQFIGKHFPGIKINVLAEGGMNEAVLHFAALKNPFSKIASVNSLELNQNLIQTEFYKPQLAYDVIPGSLPFYDLSDLEELLPAGLIKIINPVDAKGEKINTSESEATVLEFLLEK